MPSRPVLLILSACLLCVCLRAEEIQLKDGTKITGKLTAVSGDTFQVKTAYGDIQVPRSEVVSINFPENQPKKDIAETSPRPPVDESLDGTHYINRTERFELIAAEGWVLAPELARKSPEIVAGLKSADQTYVFLVTAEKFVGLLNTYKVLAETQYQSKFTGYEKLSESACQLDGRKGVRLIWHGKSLAANDMPMKSLVYILSYEDRMVRLTFLTFDPLFEEGLPIFEKIAASYKTIGTSAK